MVQGVENSRHVEFNMRWLLTFLNEHGNDLRARANSPEVAPLLRALLRVINSRQAAIGAIADENTYTLRYISNAKVSALMPDDDRGGDEEDVGMSVFNDEHIGGGSNQDGDSSDSDAAAMPGWGGSSDDGSDDDSDHGSEDTATEPPPKSKRRKREKA